MTTEKKTLAIFLDSGQHRKKDGVFRVGCWIWIEMNHWWCDPCAPLNWWWVLNVSSCKWTWWVFTPQKPTTSPKTNQPLQKVGQLFWRCIVLRHGSIFVRVYRVPNPPRVPPVYDYAQAVRTTRSESFGVHGQLGTVASTGEVVSTVPFFGGSFGWKQPNQHNKTASCIARLTCTTEVMWQKSLGEGWECRINSKRNLMVRIFFNPL